jgi:hypothetical protein
MTKPSALEQQPSNDEAITYPCTVIAKAHSEQSHCLNAMFKDNAAPTG